LSTLQLRHDGALQHLDPLVMWSTPAMLSRYPDLAATGHPSRFTIPLGTLLAMRANRCKSVPVMLGLGNE
jgi:hypothetical protein